MLKKFIFATILMASFAALRAQSIEVPADVNTLLKKHACNVCHSPDKKLVGPAWKDIAKKKYIKKQFIDLVYKPVPSHWPDYTPMTALPQVPKEDLQKIQAWVEKLSK